MKFTVEIECDSDAVASSGGDEIEDILVKLADRIGGTTVGDRNFDDPFLLRDSNGNTVGTAYYVED